ASSVALRKILTAISLRLATNNFFIVLGAVIFEVEEINSSSTSQESATKLYSRRQLPLDDSFYLIGSMNYTFTKE
ncbi:MAG: hypothetical protein VXZ45_02400, partial [Verrucomicrobiota bacterium]|nr:hypothetical protein [Verrucomicrobiota bacterium]